VALRCVTFVAVAGVVYSVLPFDGRRWWVGLVVGVASFAAVVPVAVRRLVRVLASHRPVYDAIEALALMLTMLVVGFASVYSSLNHDGDQLSNMETRFDAIYFTVVTLATVGYGDIVATGETARVVVTLQIIFDLAFLGAVVRVFGTAARRRVEEG
jgi:hypothetical protein